jgi:ABC-type spermidine/putrescine transport system permease subunit II
VTATTPDLPAGKKRSRFRSYLLPRRYTDILSHAYVWLCLLIFVAPFLALLNYSLQKGTTGTYTLSNFSYVFGSFTGNLLTSFRVSGLAIGINLLLTLPTAYVLVRHEFPFKRSILSGLTLPLYTPAPVLGLGLVLVYNFSYRMTSSIWGLVFAMVVGTLPLMLIPIVVAMKDLPVVFEEAAMCLGATRRQTFFRVVLPLIGPGISAGILLCFIIVFNEYLVTLFVAPPAVQTATLRVFNLVRTAGIQNSTAALAAFMQIVSFTAVIIFFRVFGSRYLKGTYLI